MNACGRLELPTSMGCLCLSCILTISCSVARPKDQLDVIELEKIKKYLEEKEKE